MWSPATDSPRPYNIGRVSKGSMPMTGSVHATAAKCKHEAREARPERTQSERRLAPRGAPPRAASGLADPAGPGRAPSFTGHAGLDSLRGPAARPRRRLSGTRAGAATRDAAPRPPRAPTGTLRPPWAALGRRTAGLGEGSAAVSGGSGMGCRFRRPRRCGAGYFCRRIPGLPEPACRRPAASRRGALRGAGPSRRRPGHAAVPRPWPGRAPTGGGAG